MKVAQCYQKPGHSCLGPLGHYCNVEPKEPCRPKEGGNQQKGGQIKSWRIFTNFFCSFTSWGKHQSPSELQHRPWILSTNPFSFLQSSSDAQLLCQTPCLQTLFKLFRMWTPYLKMFKQYYGVWKIIISTKCSVSVFLGVRGICFKAWKSLFDFG